MIYIIARYLSESLEKLVGFTAFSLLVGMVVAAALLGAGCGEPQESASDMAVSWEINPDPPGEGPATIAVAFADSAGQPIEGAAVGIEGIMTHPGMGPAMAEAREVAPGRYEAELTFTMAGDWILLLEAELPDGRSVAREKSVRVLPTK